jgi:hypothetical protein
MDKIHAYAEEEFIATLLGIKEVIWINKFERKLNCMGLEKD